MLGSLRYLLTDISLFVSLLHSGYTSCLMDDDVQGDVVKATCSKHMSRAKLIGFHVVVTNKVLWG